MASSATSENEPETSTASPEPGSGNRFFGWMRGLDVPRQPGWIGGVCAGVAARLGIDPLIVRGIVVVVAVLGGPAILLYAAAWLLLPDQSGKIHLEELLAGRLESPIAGIGALVLLSFLPVTQGFWYSGAAFWGEPHWEDSIGRTLWTLVLLGAVVALIVWFARRDAAGSTTTPTVSPATTDGRPETIPEPPPAPPAGAPAEDVAAWREHQAAWRAEREAFRQQQAATQRELRLQRAAEARERTRQSAAETVERLRLYRLANPRLSAAATIAAIGAALVVGGITSAIVLGEPALADSALPIALATATIALGVTVVVAGALRRSSGFLGFVATLALLATLAAALVPPGRQLVPPIDYGVGTGRFTQLFGGMSVVVHPGTSGGLTDLWEGAGTLRIQVLDGAAARIEVVGRSTSVTTWEFESETAGLVPSGVEGQELTNGDERWELTVGDPTATHVRTIRIWQGVGTIEIVDENELEAGE